MQVRQSALGLSGLARACQARTKFSGKIDEVLLGTLQVYKTLAATCRLKPEEMTLGFPMLLDGDALLFFSQTLGGEEDFDKAEKVFREKFTSQEQRDRLKRIWQKVSLLEEMRNNPDKSQVEVFKDMCSNFASIQRQLEEKYHDDMFLRVQIVVAVDIPEVERSLKDQHVILKRLHNVLHHCYRESSDLLDHTSQKTVEMSTMVSESSMVEMPETSQGTGLFQSGMTNITVNDNQGRSPKDALYAEKTILRATTTPERTLYQQ